MRNDLTYGNEELNERWEAESFRGRLDGWGFRIRFSRNGYGELG